MINLFEKVTESDHYRQFNYKDSLLTLFYCPAEAPRLMLTKLTDQWSQYNYILYVTEGRKIWHTAYGSYDLQAGSCVFVRKGACIIEQFFDAGFCVVMFFMPDEFVYQTLKAKSKPIRKVGKNYAPLIKIETSETLNTFFLSMSSFFGGSNEPDPSLLELKFRELILTIADDPRNSELLSYFGSLLNEPRSVSLQRVMDDNYCYNLKLEEYAELSNRSLSAFKRDFQKLYNTTPGKWLLEKRLTHAMQLLNNMNKTVGEAAFESGFENPSHFSRSFKERFGIAPTAIKQAQVV